MTVTQQHNNILKSAAKSRKDVHTARSVRIRRAKHIVKEETQHNIPIPSTGLPTEIWLHIISYLLNYDLEPLTRVNQQLRDIALDVRFRKAFAAPSWTRHRNYFNAIGYL
ncbi:hypothetical protein BJ165DRAFT_1132827 [Panaeolus papilionaceus]|nr:hypothetical protein BJ165DRAFT_1132827 [Panaeolus papilionaceus]